MNRIIIPTEWEYPKYHLGQRVEQGEIIGLEYHPPGTKRAHELGEGWNYVVLPDDFDCGIEIYREGEILPLTPESRQKLRALIDIYQMRVTALAQQLQM